MESPKLRRKNLFVHPVEVVVNYSYMFPELKKFLSQIDLESIAPDRKVDLHVLSHFIQEKVKKKELVLLNFICTHNSRRSQFAQVWAKIASKEYGIDIYSFSGGVEVTACNERTIASLKRSGFKITHEGEENPRYFLKFDDESEEIQLFSKLYDDFENPAEDFAAIMTCAHADENCPVVNGCEERITLRYNDPKEFDDTPIEQEKYDERSLEIATEMMYVFSRIQKG